MKQTVIALASTAGLLVLAGCATAPYGTTAAAEQSYVTPTVAPNTLYGRSYGENYYPAPYGERYETPYDVAPNADNCTLTQKHPSGAAC